MMRDFIVPGHPVGDCIPDVGAEIGPVDLMVSAGYSGLGAQRFGAMCDNFMRNCEHAGVRLVPLRVRTTTGNIWKWSRKFRVEALDPSKFLRNYQRDYLADEISELATP